MSKNQDLLRETLSLYLSKWKFILLFAVIALALGYLKLRYSTYEYQANATIKIKDDKTQNKLPEISSLQNYGLFKSDANNVLDEIEIIKSRALIEKVVRDLKFNVKYYVEGRVQDHEVYSKSPLSLTFNAPDSLLSKADTTFNVKINSPEDFYFVGLDDNGNKGDNEKLEKFGAPIEVKFGELTVTPNIGKYATKIGTNIKVKIIPVKKVTADYKGKLLVETKENSSVIKLSINDEVRDKAEIFLNSLIKAYNQDVINDKQLVVQTTSDFINKRLEIVSQELGDVDLTAENVQRTNKIADISTQANIALQSENQNEAQIIAAENQIQLIDYMSEYLNDNNEPSNAIPANVGIADNTVDQITRRHNDLVLERNRILKNSSEINPIVVNLTNQINSLKQNLQQSLNNIKDSNQITLSNLNEEGSRIRSQIFSTPRKEREFRDVKRQQDIKEALYLYLLQKREESAISYGVSSPNAKIVDPAYASGIPVKPKKILIMLAALVFGIAIPIGLIYLFNLLDFKIHSVEDVKKVVDVPHIGDIPKAKSKNDGIIKSVDYSAKAEAFRMVRTNLDFFLHDVKNRGKVIFVTSTTSKEGKSHTSINLAASLSYSNNKVLIIESDIRVPSSSKYLDVRNDIGLTNFITDTALNPKDVIQQADSKNENLFILPSGTIPPNPSELLLSDRVETLFDAVKKDFDYIVVDTAAVGLVTDTLLLTKFSDLFIYVVRAGYLDKRKLHVLETMVADKKLPNLTVLVNNLAHKKGYGYGYGYGNEASFKKRLFNFKF